MRLIAIASKWHIDKAEEELGDALYPHDKMCLEIKVDDEYPLVYVYSCLEADRAFAYVVREPPAYVERIVPVHKLYKRVLRLAGEININNDVLVDLKSLVSAKCIGYCSIEVHPRNIYIVYRGFATRRQAQKKLQKILASVLGLRLSRRASYSLIVEDTREGIIAALVPRGHDRVRTWRESRLGLRFSEEKN